MVSPSRAYASGYGDFTLGGEKLEVVKSLRILRVTFASKLTFETHLREVVSKAVRSSGIVRRAGKLFDCPRMLKSIRFAQPGVLCPRVDVRLRSHI